MSVRDISFFFEPRSIALVGASSRPGSVGAVLARNLMAGGFQGPILPVNPKQHAIGGAYAWPDVESLPEVPELGIVATPADVVPTVVRALREKGAKAACVITAGFGEGGDGTGRARRAALLEAAGPMRLMGPNVLGLMAPGAGLNASFAHIAPRAGDLAFVSQSGAMLTAVLDWATSRGIGFSHLVSLGDKIDVDFGDMLNYLTSDPQVRAILLYIEAIGDARKFMSAARAAARTKPVVVIKAGRFAEGARAASSHTGALAGSDRVYDAAFRRAGMLRVYDMQELFDAVQTLSSDLRRIESGMGDRLAILTNGGGIGVLATDALIERGGRLADLSEATRARLDACLPATWSRDNPVDIIGDAPAARYVAALEALLEEPGADAVLVINCPQAIADSTEAAEAVTGVLAARHKPVLTNWLGDHAAAEARRHFAARRLPTYNTAEEAVRAFMHVVDYSRNQAMLMQTPPSAPGGGEDGGEGWAPDRAAAGAILEGALADGREWLSEVEAKRVLDAYDIPIARTYPARDGEEAYYIARGFKMGDLVAVKVLSDDITHKSDVGGVVLNLTTPDQVREATDQMLARLRHDYPSADIAGVTVQEMIRRPGAHELIVGLNEDRQFGPVLLFGKGGKEVEVVGDTATGLPPLDDVLAQSLIEETDVYRLLRGYRDEPAADFAAIRQVVIRVGQLAIDFASVKELDINPLIADADGVVALDARIRVAPDARPARARLAIRPYPRELEGTVDLRDASAVRVRPVRPEDKQALKDLVARSDPDDIRFRFLHPMKALPDQLAARLSQIDYAREMAFAALVPEAGGGDGIAGVARLIADADLTEAEYAILLRRDVKGRGLGYALMRRLIDYARGVGIGRLYGDVLADNKPMLDMCEELGFAVERMPDDAEVRRVTLVL